MYTFWVKIDYFLLPFCFCFSKENVALWTSFIDSLFSYKNVWSSCFICVGIQVSKNSLQMWHTHRAHTLNSTLCIGSQIPPALKRQLFSNFGNILLYSLEKVVGCMFKNFMLIDRINLQAQGIILAHVYLVTKHLSFLFLLTI